jgi:outer membrane protein OmpA-like peptidoglycan-associated protein
MKPYQTSNKGNVLSKIFLLILCLIISALLFYRCTLPKLQNPTVTPPTPPIPQTVVPTSTTLPTPPTKPTSQASLPAPVLLNPQTLSEQFKQCFKNHTIEPLINHCSDELKKILPKHQEIFLDLKAKDWSPSDSLPLFSEHLNFFSIIIPIHQHSTKRTASIQLKTTLPYTKEPIQINQISYDSILLQESTTLSQQNQIALSNGGISNWIEPQSSALTVAGNFIHAIRQHNTSEALKYVNPKTLSLKKIVALCISMEEGEYAIHPSQPMLVTSASAKNQWVIVKLFSTLLNDNTEFGLEIKQNPVSQSWLIEQINLSKILETFGQKANQLGIPYTPLVTNPKGGDALTLYFEYDQSQLHPRAVKQLRIIADLLINDSSRLLKISGHTDSIGTDAYNHTLSQARALAVKDELVRQGVSINQVSTEAFGKNKPLFNDQASGKDNPYIRAINRRSEILLDF